ncbi:XYLOGLUCAN ENDOTRANSGLUCOSYLASE/HYDROLASE PROTEIN 8-RELATED [Salix koriyanagi]|uniref:XYLOGLUCAN ENDOTRANSGLUCOSYLASE/HYDROLASE PROTEIN 8-RELATED n=1 Tax=Salix koriyanagi TaxID=2511006 RepID=A0A9Q0U540_9ROSI|nr:XYLOGLUCAN ENDOTRANSGLUCOSYLASE/HYDROLASE PROTEIN 8-RELATED [Salix koriyanagi]
MASSLLWTACLTFLLLATVTKGTPPKKAVEVPFGRNYAPTWAFDHIKYFNGGSEIQLHLDKYTGKRWWDQKEFQDLDAAQYRRLRWVRSKYTIYNYCTDRVRLPTLPRECKRDRDI